MENFSEIIPFAKEMLNQKPTRGMLKIYMLGSGLAVLGAVGGLVESIFLPSMGYIEDEAAEIIVEKMEVEKMKQVLESSSTLVQTEDVDVQEAAVNEEKAKQLMTAGRRSSSYRLHAS
ncbi:G0/G1 switch protein 2 isoform X2 [Mugil cephalus]|nr:G0/G1 switch protein 2 isoform X2 [Mugil cephalus]